MTACHDPYRELEIYLKKAEEEIGKAFEELLQHEKNLPSSSCDPLETVLLPPPAFRSHSSRTFHCNVFQSTLPREKLNCSCMNRVCHDGNVLDLHASSYFRGNASPFILQKSLSCPAAETRFSSVDDEAQPCNAEQRFANGGLSLPNRGKQATKTLRSSLSFPEGAIDNFLREKVLSGVVQSCPSNRKISAPDRPDVARATQSRECESFKNWKPRSHKSFSNISRTIESSNTDEGLHVFPRPPSGDMNLLSIWADNLVLAVDRSMSEEMDDSISSSSPLSDYSPGFNKYDEAETNITTHIAEVTPTDEPTDDSRISEKYHNFNRSFKLMTHSPDSGISQIYTEASEDTVDFAKPSKGLCCDPGLSLKLKIDLIQDSDNFDATHCITPPPPEFEDKKTESSSRMHYYDSVKSDANNEHESTLAVSCTENRDSISRTKRPVLRAASNIVVAADDITEKRSANWYEQAIAIPFAYVDVDQHATVTTVCSIREATSYSSAVSEREVEHITSIKADCPDDGIVVDEIVPKAIQQAETILCSYSSTLPKRAVNGVNESERHSSSLPRDTGRVPASVPLRTSSSSSAVSAISQVSVDELAAFMRKVKKSTYYPPPRVDVSVDVKDSTNPDAFPEDDWNRDAVTQTTPVVPLSRSSSFTWVTECECSDWDDSLNGRSASEDSLLVFSRSASDPEKKTAPTSTSTDDDDDDDDAPGNSGCSSSLYLSACSEASDSRASDSSHDANAKPDSSVQRVTDQPTEKTVLEASHLIMSDSIKSSSSAGTLVGIPEENPISETLSLGSASSYSIGKDQPASFPSTLRSSNSSRVSDDGDYRHHPIEANVLIVNELNAKSVSAPVLLRQKRRMVPKSSLPKESSLTNGNQLREAPEVRLPPPNHSAKEWNELQAIEACTWLRATGFPQYAQMYEDNLFPIDIPTVQKDHSFLHPDSFQSLSRRLNTLNRCAQMKITDHIPRKSLHLDDSDEEEECALSENWQFQRVSRRWSRVPSPTEISEECSNYISEQSSPKPIHHITVPAKKFLTAEDACSSSHDSVFLEDHPSSPDSIRKAAIRSGEQYPLVVALREEGHSPGSSSGSGGTLSAASEEMLEKRERDDDAHQRVHRSGSDRIKEGAKALLRRMESLKGKKKKKSPVHTQDSTFAADGSSCSSLSPSPQFHRQSETLASLSHDLSEYRQEGTPQMDHRKKHLEPMYKEIFEGTAHSDSECPMFHTSDVWGNEDEEKPSETPVVSKVKTKVKTTVNPTVTWDNPLSSQDGERKTTSGNTSPMRVQKKSNLSPSGARRTGAKLSIRASHYDNLSAPLAVFNTGYAESSDRGFTKRRNGEGNDAEIIAVSSERRDSGVGASLTRASSQCYAPWHSFPAEKVVPRKKPSIIPVTELSAPQMILLRKLSLLKLTTLMEKYSPTSRTGWSWVVPKLFRRNRTPDYKDKVVFGLPLLHLLQRTGQPLPISIQSAIHYLRKTALESIGLFRKSGVRSRIQKLRNSTESDPEKVTFDDQQPYDVADMLKQYFRELPEALLTNKLSETFTNIFQYIPEDFRLEAIQAAIFMMPDENREVLQYLLSFLHEVCEHSGENQMTATNIAVCFAPSLFQRASPRSASASPRRRKTVGAPDLRELNENKAAYECLACMVFNSNSLDSISLDKFSQKRFSCLDACIAASLTDLPDLTSEDAYGWQAYTYGCIQALLKEAKDKFKGWDNPIHSNGVDLCYKKVRDNHPLRLWKVSTEVEAPPTELLNRILRDRHLWDSSFVKWRVVHTLDRQTEVFQFVCNTSPLHKPRDYCTLRSWRTELPKGACVLVEASVNHPDANLMVDGVRGIILASRYFIEPCGSGKSRIAHISRVDTKGRSPDWYNRAYGHICALNLRKLRDSFSLGRTEGRETKV